MEEILLPLGHLEGHFLTPGSGLERPLLAKDGVVACTVRTRGFPGGSDGKESACNVGDMGLIPGS